MSTTLKRQQTFNNYGTSLICESVVSNFFDNFVKSTNLNLDMPIIDIGCGFGRAAAYLAKKGAKQIYAIDLCHKNIKKIEDDYPEFIKSKIIIPVVADFSNKNTIAGLLEKHKFSMALLINVIHFWNRKTLRNNLSKICHCLADNGYLITLVQLNTSLKTMSSPPRFNIYPASLKTILLESGFKAILINDKKFTENKYLAVACKKDVNLDQIMSWYNLSCF